MEHSGTGDVVDGAPSIGSGVLRALEAVGLIVEQVESLDSRREAAK